MTVCDLLCFSATLSPSLTLPASRFICRACFVFLCLNATQSRVQSDQGPRSPLSSPPSLLVQLHQISGGEFRKCPTPGI